MEETSISYFGMLGAKSVTEGAGLAVLTYPGLPAPYQCLK